MNNDLLLIFTSVISSSLLTSVATAWLNRRKNRVEIADKINQMASRLIDDMDERIQQLEDKVRIAETQALDWKRDSEIRQQRNKILTEKLDAYRDENEVLKSQIDVLETKIDKLESHFANRLG